LNAQQRTEINKQLIMGHKSLINILNNEGPKIKSCGTSDSMGKPTRKGRIFGFI
jgi:hypothetical protein